MDFEEVWFVGFGNIYFSKLEKRFIFVICVGCDGVARNGVVMGFIWG